MALFDIRRYLATNKDIIAAATAVKQLFVIYHHRSIYRLPHNAEKRRFKRGLFFLLIKRDNINKKFRRFLVTRARVFLSPYCPLIEDSFVPLNIFYKGRISTDP
uniref:Uncharacterized protein n=1 Tax=Corethron hystrix TaxID=216773 RepID=A0A6U5J8I9_9STRA